MLWWRSQRHKQSFVKKFFPSWKQSTKKLCKKAVRSIVSKSSTNTSKVSCVSCRTVPWLNAWVRIGSMWSCSDSKIDKEENDNFSTYYKNLQLTLILSNKTTKTWNIDQFWAFRTYRIIEISFITSSHQTKILWSVRACHHLCHICSLH